MDDWAYAQANNSEELAQLHFFSVTKRQPGGQVTFRVTVKEYATPPEGQFVRFFWGRTSTSIKRRLQCFLAAGVTHSRRLFRGACA